MFLKTKIRSRDHEAADFHDYEIPNVDSGIYTRNMCLVFF